MVLGESDFFNFQKNTVAYDITSLKQYKLPCWISPIDLDHHTVSYEMKYSIYIVLYIHTEFIEMAFRKWSFDSWYILFVVCLLFLATMIIIVIINVALMLPALDICSGQI